MIRRIVNWVKGLFTKEADTFEETGIPPMTVTAMAAGWTALEVSEANASLQALYPGFGLTASVPVMFLGVWLVLAAFWRGDHATKHLALTGKHDPVTPLMWFAGFFFYFMSSPVMTVTFALLFSLSVAGIIELWRKFRVSRRSVRVTMIGVRA